MVDEFARQHKDGGKEAGRDVVNMAVDYLFGDMAMLTHENFMEKYLLKMLRMFLYLRMLPF